MKRLILTVLFTVTPCTMFAQGVGDTTGTLNGIAQDQQGVPLPGVLITATGQMGSQTASTDINGKFIFPYLTPGVYKVKSELQGYNTVDYGEVRIGLDQRIRIFFIMKPAAQEIVEVPGEFPLLDVASTTTGANITDTLLGNIPIGRSFISSIYLAPGVGYAGSGIGKNPSISGASGLENTYIIDGVNITDPGYGTAGAFSVTYGSFVSGTPTDMIKEVQVKTGGFEPEYGEALGGVVNVITKSGGNQFAGEVYVYSSPSSLKGAPKEVSSQDSIVVGAPKEQEIDGGLNFGGPIIKDRVFFFAAYNPRRETTIYANDPRAPRYSDFPEAVNVHITQFYSFKVTADITTNHTIEFSFFADPSHSGLANQNGNGLDSTNPLISQSKLEYGSSNQVGRWNAILGNNMFLEAQVARSHNEFREILGPLGNQYRIQDFSVRPSFSSGGVGSFDSGSNGTNTQYSVKLTNIWEKHEIRYGLQYQDIDYRGGRELSGPTRTAFNGQQTATGTNILVLNGDDAGFPEVDKVYIASSFLIPQFAQTSTNYWNWFAQDSWNVASFLNIKLGIRWEQQRIKGNPQGSEDITFKNNWAPRIGGTYDYLRSGKSKIYAQYGRFFEKIPNDLAVRTLIPSSFVSGFYYDSQLTQLIPGTGRVFFTPPFEVEGLGRSKSPYETRAEYQNEFVVGLEQEVRRDFTLGGHFIYRNVGNALEDIQLDLSQPCVPYIGGMCVPPGVTAENYLSNPTTYLITNLDGHYPSFPKFIRDYKALEITAEKRLSNNWQVLASYRYARLNGNYEGLFRRDNGHANPNISSLGDFAPSPYLGFTYVTGPLPNDVQHSFKLFGAREFRSGFATGLGLNFNTGSPMTELGAIPYFGSNERLLSPRAALGRTDSIFSIDLHADYDFQIAGQQKLTFGLDVFNVFNSQSILEVQQNSEFDNGTYSPFVNVDFLKPTTFQDSRIVRLFLKYSF